MNALTICEPYASLIMLPFEDPRAKRVENRTWTTMYRGPLLIHAGKSNEWLEPSRDDPKIDIYGFEIDKFKLGYILGIVDMVDCLPAHRVGSKYPKLKKHIHTSGPFCFVLANIRRFSMPAPCKGKQRFFQVPDSVVGSQMASLINRGIA